MRAFGFLLTGPSVRCRWRISGFAVLQLSGGASFVEVNTEAQRTESHRERFFLNGCGCSASLRRSGNLAKPETNKKMWPAVPGLVVACEPLWLCDLCASVITSTKVAEPANRRSIGLQSRQIDVAPACRAGESTSTGSHSPRIDEAPAPRHQLAAPLEDRKSTAR
jgi:hypothetical protein